MPVTGLSSYRDYKRAYVNPHIGASKVSGLDKTIVHGLYKLLLNVIEPKHWTPADGTVDITIGGRVDIGDNSALVWTG